MADNRDTSLTSVRHISQLLEKLQGKIGRRTAAQALEYVLENSASPRESKTAILLILPVRLGGYGFPLCELNHRFDYTLEEQKVTGVPYAILDLWWEDRHFGIEYDGGKGHTEAEAIARDRKKSGNLQYLGETILRVDKFQMSSPSDVYALAKKASRIMGIRFREPTPEQWRKKCELFDIVMRQGRI